MSVRRRTLSVRPLRVANGRAAVIRVFGFLTAGLVAALLTLVFFLQRRIVQSRNSAANSSLSLLMDSRCAARSRSLSHLLSSSLSLTHNNYRRSFSPQRPERIRTDVNNSSLLVAEERF